MKSSSSSTQLTKSVKSIAPHLFEDMHSSIFELPLNHFGNSLSVAHAQGLPCSMHDYLDLIDRVVRIVHNDKNQAMTITTPPILTLTRLSFTLEQFQ